MGSLKDSIESFKINPLTEQHLQDMNDALKHITNVRESIRLAERAGIDVTEHKKLIDEHEQKIKQIKSVYFPDR
jgi:hypothetical protein